MWRASFRSWDCAIASRRSSTRTRRVWSSPADSPIAAAAPPSAHVDVDDFDGVVAVAESIPGRDFRLDVPGGIGRARAHGVPSDVARVPVERPILPLVRAFRGLEVRQVPVAFAGEADLDLCHGSGSRPRLAAHG